MIYIFYRIYDCKEEIKSELLEKCLSIAKSTFEETLKKLVEDGFVKKNGVGKSTYYYKA